MPRWEDRFAPRPEPGRNIARARELRRTATAAERDAWTLLRDRQMLGLKFKRHHVIGGLIVDFYCAELRLVLELDGESHADRDRTAHDAARTEFFEARGISVLRLRNEDVSERTLRDLVCRLTDRPPLPEGERGQG